MSKLGPVFGKFDHAKIAISGRAWLTMGRQGLSHRIQHANIDAQSFSKIGSHAVHRTGPPQVSWQAPSSMPFSLQIMSDYIKSMQAKLLLLEQANQVLVFSSISAIVRHEWLWNGCSERRRETSHQEHTFIVWGWIRSIQLLQTSYSSSMRQRARATG